MNSPRYTPILTYLCQAYILTGFALSGIPGYSRMAAVSEMLLGIYLGYLVRYKRLIIPKTVVWPLLFLLNVSFTTIYSDNVTLEALIKVFSTWFGALFVYTSLHAGVKITALIHAMIMAAGINSIAHYAGYDSMVEILQDDINISMKALMKRASGLTAGPNVLAIQAILPLFLLTLSSVKVRAVPILIGMALAYDAVVISGSRKGILLLPILFLVFIASRYKLLRYKPLFMAVAIFLSILVFVGISDADIYGNLMEIHAFDRIDKAVNGKEASYDGRVSYIEQGLKLFLNAPVLGYGFNMFRRHSMDGLYSHNNYIELLVNGGVVALLAYYNIYYQIIKQALADASVEKFIVIMVMVMLFVESSMVSFDTRIFPLLILCLLFISRTHSASPSADHNMTRRLR